MNKALIFGARIRAKATKVVELEETIEELNKRSVVELEKLDRAETEEEVSAVEKTVDGLQKEIEEKEAEKAQLEKEIDELEKQIEEQNRKAPTPGKTEKRGGKTLEQREAFNHYLRTKEVRADGLKSAEGEAIIPVELMTPKEAKQDKTDLTSLVNIVNVKNASGKWAVVKLTDQTMNTVEELEENPELAKPTFTKVNYEIKTRRGHLPVNIASKFNEDLGIDGVILTKLDGDTRGGAAISIKKVTGKPIKYIGTGEKLNEIEEFHPDRMASRILGMGDVLTLIEQAQEQFDAEEAEKLEKKFRKNKDFDLNDYLTQMKQIKKLGSISSLLKKIPGFGQYSDQVSDKELDKITAVIQSMTEQERTNPKVLNASRRIRIANGSGTSVQFINKFMKTFEQMQTMMKQMRGGKPNPLMKKMMKSMNLDGLSEKDLEDFENKLK